MAGKSGDLVLIAELDRPLNLLVLVGAYSYVRESLGVSADLIPAENPHKKFRDSILME